MPIYPGDRVPADRQQAIEKARRRGELLKSAADYLGNLIAAHHQLIIGSRPPIAIRVQVPNGKTSIMGHTCYDTIERDAWILWQRKYMGTYFANPDAMPEAVPKSENLLVTPQRQVAVTSSRSLYDWELSDIGTKPCSEELQRYISKCADAYGAASEDSIGRTVIDIEAAVRSL